MPELGTAWVTLAVSTKNMERDIKRSFREVERASKVSPDVDTTKMSSRATAAGMDFGRKFSAATKASIGALGAAMVGGAVLDQFKQVMSVGMDYTKNMNTMQSVSGATAAQMKQVSAAARQLGTDASLPATSANDAAAAMTELAKGGFTVQQSMDAARGSLQLAAAAGISAADAATIQSSTLQAFGLGADSAGKMADTLANASNASSAEITDVAQALAQAGTVANQFGLTAEDTASAIALLANNGIKGSDAGTLLKTGLQALTDQGNPAQGAIEELGLTVYDAQGKFVGLSKLMGQLGDASKRMTPEAYQAATATLFGSDAMRLAGVAAKDGAASYDKMRTAINRQGAAAEVAAAKTKGLPGAWERFKNGLEDLQLKAYDALEGPATSALNGLTNAMTGLSTWVSNNKDTLIGFWDLFGSAVITSAQQALQAIGEITVAAGQLMGGIGNVEGAMLKVQSAAARFRGDGEEADRLNAEAEAAFGWGESVKDAGNKMLDTARNMDGAKDRLHQTAEEARTAADTLSRLGGTAAEATKKVSDAFNAVPGDVPINISAPGAESVYKILTDLNQQVTLDNDKNIVVKAPLAPDVITTLESLNIKVREDNGKLIVVKQEGAEEAGKQIDDAANKPRTASISVIAKYGPGVLDNPQIQQQFINDFRGAFGAPPITRNAEGSIQGAPKLIDKPEQADIYQGVGAGTIFAEKETGGEAYIPLAPEKRDRSTAILAEVAKIFGLTLSAPSGSSGSAPDTAAGSGGIVSALATAVTNPIVNALEKIRDAISRGGGYSGSSSYSSDAALLAMVPKGGRYDASGDLSKGLADCTSGIEDLVNLLDGQPTAGRSMSTANAAEWLAAHGFVPTDSPVAGAFNVGYNSHHMEGTLPGGTNVNFGSDASVASGGVSGAAGAWGDPSFTQHYYRAAEALSTGADAWDKLTKSNEVLTDTIDTSTTAATELTDTLGQQVTQTDEVMKKADNGTDASSFGQSLMSGMMQTIGLDGSVFSDPTQWPNFKSAMALVNWGGAKIQALAEGSPSTDTLGGGGGIADLLAPLTSGALQPIQRQPDSAHTGTGAQPGPSVVVNGNVGMDPRQFTQRVDAAQNQAVRRNLSAVRPG